MYEALIVFPAKVVAGLLSALIVATVVILPLGVGYQVYVRTADWLARRRGIADGVSWLALAVAAIVGLYVAGIAWEAQKWAAFEMLESWRGERL